MNKNIFDDMYRFGEYKKFVSDDVWEYFLAEYKKRDWRGYPSGLPYIETEQDADCWFDSEERKIKDIMAKLESGELKYTKLT